MKPLKPRENCDLLKKGGVHSQDRKSSKRAKRKKDKRELKRDLKEL
jgi:hypothetical protein